MRKLVLFFMVSVASLKGCLAQAFELGAIVLASGDTLRGAVQGKSILQNISILNVELS